jgi:hypothetical protein
MYPKISLRSDHCRGIDAVLSQGKIGEIYNIGGRSESVSERLPYQHGYACTLRILLALCQHGYSD